ncbi:uncharacterized protein LOC141648669 [Silene latifolia]|uniref:uncharacterized protein LOC141648669 n=1 Tax=Silene latifolia TaxID=37657 RepID=UPI003D76F8AB
MATSLEKGKGVIHSDDRRSADSFFWDEGTEEEEARGQLMPIGRIWAQKSIKVKAAIETMIKLWNTLKPIIGNVINAKEKMFVFRFGTMRDKDRVLENQSWHFGKFVWCFNEPTSTGKLTDIPLFHLPLWARVYDLPISGRKNEGNVRKIRVMLGTYINMELRPNPEMDRAIRVLILHDIRIPLKKMIKILMPTGKEVCFDVKYERLPTFCYGYGRLGHGEKDCKEGPYEEDELKFGE